MFLQKHFDAPKKGILMPLKHALKSDALGGSLFHLMDAVTTACGQDNYVRFARPGTPSNLPYR